MHISTRQSLARKDVIRGRERIRKILTSSPVETVCLVTHFIGGTESRAGFFVSRRIGKSVSRNLYKRRMREIYRCNRDVFPKGDIIFRLRHRAQWQKLREDFIKTAEKLVKRNA